jgi:uroporphyrinogen decarboxylase
MDPMMLRQKYGPQMRLVGGIDKRAMAAGPEAIDAQLLPLAPLFVEGGFIPWCDHLVPPDVPFQNYLYYVNKMKDMSLNPRKYL